MIAKFGGGSARWTALADEWGEGARTLAGGAEVTLSRAAEEPDGQDHGRV